MILARCFLQARTGSRRLFVGEVIPLWATRGHLMEIQLAEWMHLEEKGVVKNYRSQKVSKDQIPPCVHTSAEVPELCIVGIDKFRVTYDTPNPLSCNILVHTCIERYLYSFTSSQAHSVSLAVKQDLQ